MSLKLTRFSQEVDLESGSLEVAYFAVFQQEESGRELRLPISQSASQAIIAFVADKPAKEVEDTSTELFDSEKAQIDEYYDEPELQPYKEAVPSL